MCFVRFTTHRVKDYGGENVRFFRSLGKVLCFILPRRLTSEPHRMYYMFYGGSRMKTMTAREANHGFSDLLARVERGEEVLITKRGTPVAVLSPYRPPAMTSERQAAIDHAIKLMAKGLPWPEGVGPFTRDEMHER
jgi:prevent-host-death family protein